VDGDLNTWVGLCRAFRGVRIRNGSATQRNVTYHEMINDARSRITR
jgi:hypothetical protein